METNQKWIDEEDLNENYVPEEVSKVHKKLIRKGPNLAKELREYHASKTTDDFTNWAKHPSKQTTKKSIAAQKLQSDHFGDKIVKPDVAVKKFVQTTVEDSLSSVVQTIDSMPGTPLVAYGGFDKVLKIAKIEADKRRNYTVLKSLYFEDCPIISGLFYAPAKHILSFLKKPFINFYDSEVERSSCVYKLFEENEHPEKLTTNATKELTAVWSRHYVSIFDNNRQLKTGSMRQPEQVNTCAFLGHHRLAVACQNQTVYLYDIRKGLSVPFAAVPLDSEALVGNENYFVSGNRYGIAELRKSNDQLELIKRYDQLTTAITSVSLSDTHFVFGSRWKKNAVRIVDLGSQNILPKWPNVKTNLRIVTSAHLFSNNTVSFGTAQGALNCYHILQ